MKNEVFCVPDGLEELKQSIVDDHRFDRSHSTMGASGYLSSSPGLVSGDRTGPTDL
jgi:hypothetical protein